MIVQDLINELKRFDGHTKVCVEVEVQDVAKMFSKDQESSDAFECGIDKVQPANVMYGGFGVKLTLEAP